MKNTYLSNFSFLYKIKLINENFSSISYSIQMSHSGSTETGTTPSIELSIPTDLTVTSEGDSEDPRQNNIRRHAKEIYSLTSEKRQLQNVTERLQLELKEKNSQIESLKSQYSSLVNQRNFQNDIKLSEKQAKVNRLEGELMTSNEELRLLKERAAKELANLLQKCFEFQQNQSKLMVKHDELKSSLINLSLSEEEFSRMKLVPEEQLSLQKFASLRVYEKVMPLKIKNKELEITKSSLESSLSAREKELENKVKENSRKTEEANQLRERLVELSAQCEELRSELKLDDYRVHNFDRIKRDRDKYEEERETLREEKSELELSVSIMTRERKVLEDSLADLKARLRLQEQDLSKYKNEFFFAQNQLEKGKENTIQTSSRLRLEKERNEDIHERYLKAREEVLSLAGSLQDAQTELKTWRDKFLTTSESEKEVRNRLNECQKQFKEVSDEMDFLQSKYLKERETSKLEITEFKARYNSLSKSYNHILKINSKTLKDTQEIQSALQEERLAKEQATMRLKQDATNLAKELNQYKSLENDYMATLKVFASGPEMPKHSEGHPITTSIVRGKHAEETISLTRRILHLEKQNFEACSTINKFIAMLGKMRISLSSYKTVLTMTKQPVSQLLDKIRTQEETILSLEEAFLACGESKKNLLHEFDTAKSWLSKMESLNQEIADIKTEMLSLRRAIA